MSRKGLWVAAAVVIVSNVYALGSAGFNRGGDPDAVLTLTERELRLAPREVENTAMSLRLNWTDPAEGGADAGWFNAAKLAEIGFDCRMPATRDNAEHYQAMPPRAAYAVLEYDGEAWQRYLAAPPASVDRETAGRRSHLVVVDVGNDARALRVRYPDRQRTIVVPATASLAFVARGTSAPFLKGRVNVAYPMELNVPRGLRHTLDELDAPPSRTDVSSGRFERNAGLLPYEPRYRVTVRWGRALEPWVESVQPVSQGR